MVKLLEVFSSNVILIIENKMEKKSDLTLEKIREQNRKRAAKFYEKNKEKINKKRKKKYKVDKKLPELQ